MSVELIKSMVRPILIISGWGVWLYMILSGITIPETLSLFVAAISGEYFAERAYKRIKETKET